MNAPPQFEDIVVKYFDRLVTEFGFHFVKPHTDEIQYYNEKCIVRLIYDRGAVSCHFIDPVEKEAKERARDANGLPAGYLVYSSYSVWEMLYPNDPVNYRYGEWDLEGQIKAESRLLFERLVGVLEGDFSWKRTAKS